jgi:hypothetical protein
MPKVILSNTSAEYWRGDCSLIHTDPTGTHDLVPLENVRIYHFAGTQHGEGVIPLTDLNPNDGCRGNHPFNAVNYLPLVRAALMNLDRWVAQGIEPPPSAHSRLADGTAVAGRSLAPVFQRIPGAAFPNPDRLPRAPHVDPGRDAERGIGSYPPELEGVYPTFVCAVDSDGNEVAGVRMPDVAVPVASYTGWNPRHPETGQPDQIIPMQGSTFPFPPTAEARHATCDPRPSIAERYQDRADYLARARAAAEVLAAQRYLLPEDVDVVVNNAAARYDLFVGKTTA